MHCRNRPATGGVGVGASRGTRPPERSSSLMARIPSNVFSLSTRSRYISLANSLSSAVATAAAAASILAPLQHKVVAS